MFNLMSSLETSKISPFRKRNVNSAFYLKEKIEKSYTKKDECRRRDINDMVFINEKENEKEKKSATGKTIKIFLKEKYFYKGNLMEHIIYCGKNLD